MNTVRTLDMTGSKISEMVSRMISCVGRGTLGSRNMRMSVGQAVSSAESCTMPTQDRISNTRAALLARHFGARSVSELSRSVKGDS